MHQIQLRLTPNPDGEFIVLPRPPSWIWGKGREKKMREMEERKRQ